MKPKVKTTEVDRSSEPLSPQAFGERIRLALFGHKVREIAKAVGVSPSAIYNWISGTNEPNLTKLSAFATATQVSVQWLITGRGEMREASPAFHSIFDVRHLLSAENQDAAAAVRRELEQIQRSLVAKSENEKVIVEDLHRIWAKLNHLAGEIASLKRQGAPGRGPQARKSSP